MRCSTTLRVSRILAFLLVAATPVVPRPSAAQVPEPPPTSPAQPRDAAPAKGTAAILGRVTNLETGAPLRRSLIQITSSTLPSERRVSTNSDGRFEVRDLPAGAYSVKAARGGYLTLAHGQRRPGEMGNSAKGQQWSAPLDRIEGRALPEKPRSER